MPRGGLAGGDDVGDSEVGGDATDKNKEGQADAQKVLGQWVRLGPADGCDPRCHGVRLAV